MATRTAKLEAALARRPPWQVSQWNLDALSDADLEALLPLAEKRATEILTGTKPTWATEEVALLGRLWAKQAGMAP